MHCIQDILQSNDNDDLLSNASPHSSISSAITNGSTPSNASLCAEHHQTITVSFFDAVKKWLNGKEKEKKEFGEIMRKIRNQSSFDEISQRARKLFRGRNDFYQQLMLLVSPSHIASTLIQNENISLQLPTLNETMHIDFDDDEEASINSTANLKPHSTNKASQQSMLNLVPSNIKPMNDKKRKRDQVSTNESNLSSNGHNPSKKRKTSNHTLSPTNTYHHLTLKNKTNNNRNFESISTEYQSLIPHNTMDWHSIDHGINTSNYQRTTYLLPSTSNASSSASTTSSIATTPQFMDIETHSKKKHRKNKHKDKKRDKVHNKANGKVLNDVVLTQLMDGLEEDMGLPIHILATIKQELIKDNPRNFQLFLQGMALCSIGIIKADQFVNMMSPLFVKNKKLKLVLHQLRTILHVPLHYFHSTPLYAPFLSDLSTSDKNMNLSIRANAEQYSHIVDNNDVATKIRMVPSSYYASLSPKKANVKRNKSMSVSRSKSYRRNPYYKKNMWCSSKEYWHLLVVNDTFVSRSTGAENNPENDHMANRNKHEMELNEKEHTMTLWDYYVEQNAHAIQCLSRLESRILYLYAEYKKMFIIRDDYDDAESNDSIVDCRNVNFYDSDTYTTVTEDLVASDSDITMDDNDAHSTTSEPLKRKNICGNESDGTVNTVNTTRSDMTPMLFPSRRPMKRRFKLRRKRRKRIDKRETDKKYVLSRIYSDIDMDSYITPICWSAIQRLYSDEMLTIRSAFNNNPLCTISIILPRLEKKHNEWCGNRKIAGEIYRDVATRNSVKALDWQPKYKRLDKTRLSSNELWRELIAAQSLLNGEYLQIIETERHKRSGLKEQQRSEFNRQYSPMDAASSIKPTRLICSHFRPKINSDKSSCFDGNDDISFDFGMNIYYNYGQRFDVSHSDYFCCVINLPLTTHEHCWNVMAQYLSTENQHKKIGDTTLFDMIRFYCNFIFLLFEIDLFHQELFPHFIFGEMPFKSVECNNVYRFNDLLSIRRIGADICDLPFESLVFDGRYFGENIDLNSDEMLMSYHNRKSHIILVNRDIYNILRLYIHLFQRLQRARDLVSCINRWRLDYDPQKKEENEEIQKKNELEFFGKLMALIQGQIKDTEFDLIIQKLFGPQGYECSNIKYLIKNLCCNIQSIIKKSIIWDLIKLWHSYYTKWKVIPTKNTKQRIALLRRYYCDIKNILKPNQDIVMIEYFLDSKEIGVQYLGISSNIYNTHNWHTHTHTHNVSQTKIKKTKQMIDKYRSKKMNKYKRINRYIDNVTMNVFPIKSFSKRSYSLNHITWYHPNSSFYFQSINLSKIRKNKSKNKLKRFNLWHQKRFKQISNTKYNNHLFTLNTANNLFQSTTSINLFQQQQQQQQQPQYQQQYYVNNTQQPTQYVAANYPQYAAYGPQYIIQQQPNTSYVMDNRTGSIYAAIPAPGHFQQSVYPQTQIYTMSTPPNVSLNDNNNESTNNNNSNSMQLPVLSENNNNTKSDL